MRRDLKVKRLNFYLFFLKYGSNDKCINKLDMICSLTKKER
jgi:hypothetical protein